MIKHTLHSFQLILTFLIFISCSTPKESSDRSDSTTAMEHPTDESKEPLEQPQTIFNTDSLFRIQLSELFKTYNTLQKALVASDSNLAATAATAMIGTHKMLNQEQLSGDALHEWVGFSGVMEAALKNVSGASTLREQRMAFSGVSDQMYRYIRAFGLSGSTAYYVYCPMALNYKGAYWLTDAREVRNPYFGDQMLKCGSLRQQLN